MVEERNPSILKGYFILIIFHVYNNISKYRYLIINYYTRYNLIIILDIAF